MSSVLSKLKLALTKTSDKISGVFKKVDISDISDIEDALISSDIGPEVTEELINHIKKHRPDNALLFIKEHIKENLSKYEYQIFNRNFPHKPHVLLIIGVNGNGKTTTIAKLANMFQKEGKHPRIAACDTFRAAAIDQLKTWATRLQCDITLGTAGKDPSAVAYSAYTDAVAHNNDILIIDTAGRLHTKVDLMDELLKTKRVLNNIDSELSIETILVIDAIIGQSALSQTESFSKAIGIDSIIATKLDSSSKGGIIVGITKQYGIPISAICFGENIDDICEFDAEKYVDSIF